ncbi:hypothetical protein [Lentibacillus jeotgali]|uniref:hypothetical protein n=1 Tax=Lentibacillus jeotgali TaxID=558169 RepID=UPI0002627846|nr:hypothetical protein [Lentibacillus jeotgali]
MEQITMIIALVSLGGCFVLFLTSILNFLQNVFSEKHKTSFLGNKWTKSALGLFALYIVSFAAYIFTQF